MIRRVRRMTVLGLAAVVMVCGPALDAQEPGGQRPRPGSPQTEQQKRGEARFLQNCTLCHNTADNRGQKGLGILAPTDLIGFYKRPNLNDAVVKAFILNGSPGKMPGFKYTLEPEDVDDLIAYLKIR